MNKVTFISGIFLLGVSLLQANISGIVFQDLPVDANSTNIYGEQDANEQGVSGITVTAFPENISTTTDQNGSWSLNTNSANIRVEFSGFPSYLQESPIGTDNKSSIQFINNNGTANLGLHNPDDYIGANPHLTTTHFINGKNALNSKKPTTFSWPIGNSGIPNSNQVTLSTTDEIRSTWGLAYDKTNKKLYSSTLLKRHVSIGENGLGAIYVTKLDDNTSSLFRTLDAGILDDAARNLDEANLPNTDADTLSLIAKRGLGDIDISEDKSILYVINLFDKKIYEINTNTKDIIKSYIVPGPTCNNGHLRPFAITQHDDALYVGTVCDASSSNCIVRKEAGYCEDLTAQVYKLALGATTGTEIFKMRLDYKKEYVHLPQKSIPERHNWNPWTDKYEELVHNSTLTVAKRVFHPTPILSNIKFDENNNMFLAFADRSTMQTEARQNDINGTLNKEHIVMSGGDVLKVKYEDNNTYSLLDVNLYDDNTSIADHAEGALGAVAYIKGSNQIVFTEYDPYDGRQDNPKLHPYDTKGVTFNNATTGARGNSYAVTAEQLPSYSGKGSSIGDLEIITDAAPTQIGNRLWLDDNNNCIQDANETGIDAIKIQLLDDSNSVVDEQNTSNGGYYVFSNIIPNKNYTVRIDDMNQSLLATRALSTNCANVNGLINNDAIVNGNYADISVNATDIHFAGANNYSFDFGFHPKNILTYSLGDYVWLDTNRDGVQDTNESGINGIKVNLYPTADCSGAIAQTTTTANGGTPVKDGYYLFPNLNTGDYCVEFILPADHTVSPTSGADDARNSDANTAGQITNINLTADTLDEDVGIYPTPAVPALTYSLGDYVWLDTNRDGVQDTNESGINGIKVNLYPTADCSGAIAQTTTTANGGTPVKDGYYLFPNLNTGDYCVEFILPADHTVSPTSGADDARNSDANTAGQITNINLTADTLDEDVGIYPNGVVNPATINHSDGSCTCHPYEEKSVAAFNLYGLLIMMLLTSIIAIGNKKRI